MPRHARIIRPEAVYHVTHRGNNKDAIFHEASDYHYYLGLLKAAQKRYPFQLFHYVLMPNHIHLILRSSTSQTISIAIKWVAQMYAVHFNATYGKSGHLWGDRYFSKEIDNDAYLLTAGIYVELNPVRAGIVSSPQKYRWSSYRYYGASESNQLLDYSPAYLALHAHKKHRQAIYTKLAQMWGDFRNPLI